MKMMPSFEQDVMRPATIPKAESMLHVLLLNLIGYLIDDAELVMTHKIVSVRTKTETFKAKFTIRNSFQFSNFHMELRTSLLSSIRLSSLLLPSKQSANVDDVVTMPSSLRAHLLGGKFMVNTVTESAKSSLDQINPVIQHPTASSMDHLQFN
ncbi:hypothetical protein KIN20_026469 [Parelaphostrongylus tenuis]|uniref:Uncharacterized protein n=1 Tax=Parelaphostrongylus tenuis TaxID=148309 RepID=A0AAD5QY40_PARTN|nr:hypothetical protein KIN20_026469 [Parelaphostrongylus tenuis]